MIFNIWSGRNAQLHETERIAQLHGLPQLKQAITQEFNLGLHRLPAHEFSIMFTTRMDIVLKRPIESLRHWLLTIRLGQELHGGIEQIQDEISENGPLRTWLGLHDL